MTMYRGNILHELCLDMSVLPNEENAMRIMWMCGGKKYEKCA